MRVMRTFITKMLAGTALAAFSIQGASAMTLTEALEEAYRSNPTLLAAREGQKATDESVAQAQSGWRPNVTLSGQVERNYTDTRNANGAASRWFNTKTGALNVSQNLYDGGQTSALTNQAESAVRAGLAGLRVSEQNVFLSVIQSYVDLVRDQATVELNTNNVEVLERQLQATRDRFEVGEITLTDVAQAEARLSRTIATLESSAGTLATSLASFERDVGVPAVNISSPPLPADLPTNLDAALSLALANNPTLINAQEVEIAADFAIDSEFANILPSVTLDGTLSHTEDASSDDDRTQAAAIGVNLVMPLYQGGAVHSQIREAKKTLNQRKIEVEEVRRSVIQVVKSAWENLQASRAQIESRRSQVTAAEVALEGVRQEAAVGARTTLDVLDAEQELLDAQVALVAAERDEHIAAYQLISAVGALDAQSLGLNVDAYDPQPHYEATRDRWFGWDRGQ